MEGRGKSGKKSSSSSKSKSGDRSQSKSSSTTSNRGGGRGGTSGRGRGRGRGASGRGRGGGGGREASGRGTSTGRGRGGRGGRGGQDDDELAVLPESLRAFSGWTEITKDIGYEIVMKEYYNGFENGRHMCQIYENMADRVVRAINRKGMPLNTYSIFSHLLSDVAILTIVEYTNEQLVINGYAPTNLLEFKMFLGTRWLRSRLRVSPDLAFEKMKDTAKVSGFILMDLKRYKQIFTCIRGYPLDGRHKNYSDEATWMKRGVLLRELQPLEKEVFSKSVETLLNRSNGHLVIDDELIGSRSKDVESKTLSNRKAGKEGPSADCVACSFTSVLYGV